MHANLAQAAARRPAQQTAQVLHVAVYAAIGAEAHQMKSPPFGQELVCQGVEGVVAGKAAVLDGLADAHQLLPDDAPRADREMAHLGISHLPFRQAHRSAAGLDQGVGVGVPEGVHHRGFGGADGVVVVG